MPSEKKKKLKQENRDLESVSLIKQEPVSSSSHSDEIDSSSPTKKKKHKHSKSKDSVSENGMGSMGQVSDNVFSPRKRKLTENDSSQNPAPSKKKKKKKHSQESDSVDDGASSSVTNSSVVSSSLQVEDNGGYGTPREKTQLHDFRFQRKNFEQCDVSSSADCVFLQRPQHNTELWLIKAPGQLDMSLLDKKKVSLSDRVVELDLADQKCEVVVSKQASELCPLAVGPSSGNLQQGGIFAGQLQIVNKIDVPSIPPIHIPPKKEHTIPDSLRQRYVPFGAETPEPVQMTKKKKKHKKDHREIKEETEKIETVAKKSKKKKKMKG
nr:uncharacterized protein LOC111109468 isoform X2 [Crassostrea virginica]